MGKPTKIAKNSSDITTRAVQLDALRRPGLLRVTSITLMGVAAAATAGYDWLAGPVSALLRDGFNTLLFQAVMPLNSKWGSAVGLEIAFALVVLGPLRAAAEAARSSFSARLRHALVPEFMRKFVTHVRSLESAEAMRKPSGEIGSQVRIGFQRPRIRLYCGPVQGIRGIVVATALATAALKVDSQLATRGLIVVPIAAALGWLIARPMRGALEKQKGRWESAPLN